MEMTENNHKLSIQVYHEPSKQKTKFCHLHKMTVCECKGMKYTNILVYKLIQLKFKLGL